MCRKRTDAVYTDTRLFLISAGHHYTAATVKISEGALALCKMLCQKLEPS